MNAIIKDLRSFRRDWKRWSTAERLGIGIGTAVLALGLLGSLVQA
ncbi:hypothetical protein [Arenibaculum pallidiluteum]|nr:hypothetical protein [Arenibaculum pallidiluteum]